MMEMILCIPKPRMIDEELNSLIIKLENFMEVVQSIIENFELLRINYCNESENSINL